MQIQRHGETRQIEPDAATTGANNPLLTTRAMRELFRQRVCADAWIDGLG
ncbi:hypothetical protein [Thermomonas sp.]